MKLVLQQQKEEKNTGRQWGCPSLGKIPKTKSGLHGAKAKFSWNDLDESDCEKIRIALPWRVCVPVLCKRKRDKEERRS